MPELLTALASRITKISAPGFEMELSKARELANSFEPELRQKILERASPVLVGEMDDSDREGPLIEEDVDEDNQTGQSEIDELRRRLEDIGNI